MPCRLPERVDEFSEIAIARLHRIFRELATRRKRSRACARPRAARARAEVYVQTAGAPSIRLCAIQLRTVLHTRFAPCIATVCSGAGTTRKLKVMNGTQYAQPVASVSQ